MKNNTRHKLNNKHVWGAILLTSCFTLSMATLGWSNEDDRWEGEQSSFWQQSNDVPAIKNKAYQNECAACHFAYPPGFLPERSWLKIMNSLEDHFDENAELDDSTQREITRYLQEDAADQAPNRFSRSVLRSISSLDTPLRITETAFFTHKHREIPSRMVAENPKVRSFSNCLSCHSMAAKGNFDEDGVHIPGFARWED